MSVLHIANLKKTIYYLQRNGLKATWRAVRERLEQAKGEPYSWQPLSALEWRACRDHSLEMLRKAEGVGDKPPVFTVLVPAYRTDPRFLRELAQSVRAQTYPLWELLLLDASEDDGVRNVLREFCSAEGIPFSEERADGSTVLPEGSSELLGNHRPVGDGEAGQSDRQSGVVRYVKLSENAGISENTNAGLPLARGDYIGLLDHDDVLTADALQCMAEAILESRGMAGSAPGLLYSDEDKWNGRENGYYEPNFKEDFNLDLLLSNNYICHFLVLERELFRELKLRKQYDGAQDYDLVLRAVERIGKESGIRHIPRVLYHWRCHRDSTSENPRSKTYAYEAGRMALQDYADRQGLRARAKNLKHVGCYRLEYLEETSASQKDLAKKAPVPAVLYQRPDLGALGGRVSAGKNYRPSPQEKKRYQGVLIQRGSLVGGRMDPEGRVYYYGLKPGYELFWAALMQDAEAVDIRCICVAEGYRKLFEEVTGISYVTRPGSQWLDSSAIPADADVEELSLRFGRALRQRGKRILWDPEAKEGSGV